MDASHLPMRCFDYSYRTGFGGGASGSLMARDQEQARQIMLNWGKRARPSYQVTITRLVERGLACMLCQTGGYWPEGTGQKCDHCADSGLRNGVAIDARPMRRFRWQAVGPDGHRHELLFLAQDARGADEFIARKVRRGNTRGWPTTSLRDEGEACLLCAGGGKYPRHLSHDCEECGGSGLVH